MHLKLDQLLDRLGEFLSPFFLFLGDVFTVFILAFVAGVALYFFVVFIFILGAVVCWIIEILTPGLIALRGQLTHVRQQWTITPRRSGWRSLSDFSDSATPLLAAVKCEDPHDCTTTSRLCQKCFELVGNSNLLSGSPWPITRRREWHKWVLPISISNPDASASCQLCQIIWSNIDSQKKYTSMRMLRDEGYTAVWQWIAIWKDQDGGWLEPNSISLQLFIENVEPEKRTPFSAAIQIKEGLLSTQSFSSSCKLKVLEQLKEQHKSVHVPTWTGSADCIELAKSWISECEASHGTACNTDDFVNREHRLPTRLLYVGDMMSSALRLCETRAANFEPSVKYLTLSYCRGEDDISPRQQLTLRNLEEWKIHMERKDLPLTFQHAIHLTRQLGVNYLWIDALCILQDNLHDWKVESKNMGMIYANSHCTIAANDSEDAEGGCFHRRDSPNLDFPCYLRFSDQKGLSIRATKSTYDKDAFSLATRKSPLSKQAWTFQQLLLSRRVLHFGTRFLFFECNTYVASEMTTKGERQKPSVYDSINGRRTALSNLRETKSKQLNIDWEIYLHYSWSILVSKHTRGNTARAFDRSIAIEGLAQVIRGEEGGPEYMHGLWRRHLVPDMLWIISTDVAQRPVPLRAPTWSWQAVEGEVGWLGKNFRVKHRDIAKVAEVVECDDLPPSNPGAAGLLLLKCPVLPGVGLNKSQNGVTSLRVQGPSNTVKATAFLDNLDVDLSKELFCAELVREKKYEGGKKHEIVAAQSLGLLLHRSHCLGSQGVTFTYERVGAFEMEWPLVAEMSSGRIKEQPKQVFGNKTQVVRIR